MTNLIDLRSNLGFKWICEDNISVKGYIFENGVFINGKKFINWVKESIGDYEDIITKIYRANGSFAIVINTNNKVFAAVDRLRSIPIFYKKLDNGIAITDFIEVTDEENYERISEIEFCYTGYTLNNSTLSDIYNQLLAGQYIIFQEGERRIEYYYRHFRQQNQFIASNAIYYSDLTKISQNMTHRLIESAEGRTLVIPLSGGYDSRYIAAALKQKEYEKVICYSYGKKDSFETSVAKKVAEKLDYQFISIEYSDDKWMEMYQSDEMREYFRLAFNSSSLPHIQDFIALKTIKEQELIPSDSIVVPGFCGDLLGGSYLPIEYLENRIDELLIEGIERYIFRRHFLNKNSEISQNDASKIIEKIKNYSTSTKINSNNIDDFISINEAWFTEHKVSKFVVNSLRVYEYFGYEWRMPLWDNELVDYWYQVPNSLRSDNTLYNQFLFENIFSPLEIDIVKPLPLSRNTSIAIIVEKTPKLIVDLIKKIYYPLSKKFRPSDVNNFNAFGNLFLKDISGVSNDYNNVNGILAEWIIINRFKLNKTDKAPNFFNAGYLSVSKSETEEAE